MTREYSAAKYGRRGAYFKCRALADPFESERGLRENEVGVLGAPTARRTSFDPRGTFLTDRTSPVGLEWRQSSFRIVATPTPSLIVAPTALLSCMVNVSFGSRLRSPMIETEIVLDVSPGWKVSVPEAES